MSLGMGGGVLGMLYFLVDFIQGKIQAKLYCSVRIKYDDDTFKWVNKYMQEELPNYYTQQEQNAQGLAALGYANFWADKAMNGLGYSLGSIATVYLTGGEV